MCNFQRLEVVDRGRFKLWVAVAKQNKVGNIITKT